MERRLKWDELRVRVEHYKYYLSRALHVTVFFYAITGGVLGFYLKDDVETARERVRFFLLLPILIGSVLGGVFIYGARLQEKAVDSMEHIRDELREGLGLNVEELYDAQLLNILLRIFGYIYFFVAVMLVLVPPLTGSPSSISFGLAAGVCLVVGASLPVIAREIDNRLKVRRRERMLRKLKSWRRMIKQRRVDVLDLRGTDFYYRLRQSFNKETIEKILEVADGAGRSEALIKQIDTLEGKWRKRKPTKPYKGWKGWLAEIKRQRLAGKRKALGGTQRHRCARFLWRWWTSADRITAESWLHGSAALLARLTTGRNTHMTQIPEPKNETQPETPLLGSSSLIRERKEVLLGLFQENRTHVRHHESQKTTATNIVLLTTVGLIGLIKELTYKDWPLTVAVILVGVFGAAFNANEHQEIRRYKARARAYFDALDELLFKGAVRTLQSIRDKPDDVPNPQFSKSQRITVWRLVQLFWPLAISLIAVGFTIYMYYWMPHNQ